MVPNTDFHKAPTPDPGPSPLQLPQAPPHPPPSSPNNPPSTSQPRKTCEFTSPCTTNSLQTRKLISHIFGRNKISTRTFPDYVWVYFCRKHYQRARYRDRLWAGTQCEVLGETLNRMERWGGVRCWRVVVRRRAWGIYGSSINRVTSFSFHSSRPPPHSTTATIVRSGMDVDIGAKGDIDTDPDPEPYPDTGRKQRPRRSQRTQTRTRPQPQQRPSYISFKNCRKPKPAIPAPIPTRLIHELGFGKSFDDIRFIVGRLKEDISEGRVERFPDIEILPVFFFS